MKRIIIVISVFYLLFSVKVYSAFEPVGIGPRPVALSNAYTAVSNDAYGIIYNPAGLARLSRAEIATYYGSLYPGLTDGSNINQLFVGFGQPLEKYGNIGAGYYSFSLAGWYTENIMTISYAKSIPLDGITRMIPALDILITQDLNIGTSLKILGKSYSDADGENGYILNSVDVSGISRRNVRDPVFDGEYGKSGFTMDIGFQYSPFTGYNIGFAILNLIEPNLGLKTADNVSQEMKFGMALETQDLLLSIDLSGKRFINTEYKLAFGAEKYFTDGFGIRGGIALGARNFTQLSAGISYRIENLQFDYGLLLPLSGMTSNGSHRVGLTFKFGKIYDTGKMELEKEIAARIRAEAEASKARNEVERMLRIQRDLEKALKESEQARLREEKTKVSQTGGERSTVVADYINSINIYNRKVKEGINLIERNEMLEKIIEKYKNKGIDLTVVRNEKNLVNKQFEESKRNYEISMDYYRRIVSAGSSNSERIELLKSILKKYENTGIDLTEVKNELEKLQRK